MPRILAALSVLIILTAHGQITPLGTLNSYASLTYSLRTAGVKIHTTPDQDTHVLLNMDMTVFHTLALAPIQAPYTNRGVYFISEDLFDTDASTIEYLQVESYYDTLGVDHHRSTILREDGTALWSEDEVYPVFSTAWDPDRRHSVIFNTATGTVMVLRFNTISWKTYSLPGSLPCGECEGIALGAGQESGDRIVPIFGAFPNPTDNEATVFYELPPGSSAADLVFYAPNGTEVRRFPIVGSGTRSITTNDLAPGTYLYQLRTDKGVIGAKRLVVVK